MVKVSLARLLNEAILKSGKSDSQIAAELRQRGFTKISRTTIWRWHTGGNTPDLKNIPALHLLPSILGMDKNHEWMETYQHELDQLTGVAAATTPRRQTDFAHRDNTLGLLTFFAGRKPELKELQKALNAKRSIAICGLGGMGKTTLARQLIKDNESNFEHGCDAIELHPHQNADDVVALFAYHLGILVPTHSLNAALNLILTWTSELDLIFLLDNIEDEAQVVTLINALPHIRWILTSRRQLDFSNFHRLHLKPPTAAAATRMLLHYADAPATASHRAQAQQIVKRLGCLPIAIRIAGGLVAINNFSSLEDLLRWLKTEGIQALTHDDETKNLVAFFSKMLVRQPREAQDIFTLCGAFSKRRINRELFETTASRLNLNLRMLGRLASISLIHWQDGGHAFEMHPLIHEYAATQFARSSNHEAALQAFTQACVQFAETKRSDRQTTLEELDNLYQAVNYAEEKKDWKVMVEFWHHISFHHSEMNEWEAYRRFDERCLTAARFHGDRHIESAILLELGYVALVERRWQDVESLCLQAQPICNSLDMPNDTSRALRYRATALIRQNKFFEASQLLDEAEALLAIEKNKTASDVPASWSRNMLYSTRGELLIRAKKLDDAKLEIQRGIEFANSIGAIQREKMIGAQLGDVLYLQGKYDEAFDLWQAFNDHERQSTKQHHPSILLRFAFYEIQHQQDKRRALRHSHAARKLYLEKGRSTAYIDSFITAIKTGKDLTAVIEEGLMELT